jgi:hypothetical protein
VHCSNCKEAFTCCCKAAVQHLISAYQAASLLFTPHPVLYLCCCCVQVGVLGDVMSNAENVVAKGRLGPGQMVCADLETGEDRWCDLALQGHSLVIDG